VALGLAAPVTTLGANAKLFVEVESEIACPSHGALVQALTRTMSSARVVFAHAPQYAPRLVLRSSRAAVLEVELSLGAGGAHFARALSARAEECEQLAETAAQLVAAWLEEVSWNAESGVPARTGSAAQAQASPAAVRASPQESRAPAPGPATPLTAAAQQTPPPGEPEPAAPRQAPANRPSALSPTVAAADSTRDPWAVAPGLHAGTYYEPAAHRFGLRVLLSGELPLRAAFRLGLELGVDAPLRAVLLPGEVTVNAQTLAAYVSGTAYDSTWVRFDVLGSLGVERVAARSSGYTVSTSATGYGAAAAVLVRLTRALVGGLRASLLAGVQARAPARDIGVVGLGTSLPLSALRPWGGLGLFWEG